MNFSDFLGPMPDDLPSRAALDRADLHRVRRSRLETVASQITDADLDALVTREGLEDTPALEHVRRWHAVVTREDPRQRRMRDGRGVRFLVLAGAKGEGKTVALAWLHSELGGIFVSSSELVRLALSRHWQDRDELARLARCRFVGVDDVGAENGRTAAEVGAALLDFIQPRQGGGYLTVFTCNLDREAFAARIDEGGGRTFERIMHQGTVAKCGGKNLRKGM